MAPDVVDAPTGERRRRRAALAAAAVLAAVLPLASATPAHGATVSTWQAFVAAIDPPTCPPTGVVEVTLGSDLEGPGEVVPVGCSTVLHLSTHELQLGSLDVQEQVSLAIRGSASGRLVADGPSGEPGIRIVAGSGSSLSIEGGTIEASGGFGAAGIGGRPEEDGGIVYVFGGSVTADGGSLAAGIGGGRQASGGVVHVEAGSVVARGGDNGAGIGGGTAGDGGELVVSGGSVTATSGFNAAAIGGGGGGDQGGLVRVDGGTVTATAGLNGAGIGGGGGGGSGGSVAILGGRVEATGGDGGAGIGGGSVGDGGQVAIGGTAVVEARGGAAAAGIGGGLGGAGGSVEITGGTVVAEGRSAEVAAPTPELLGGAGIGSGPGLGGATEPAGSVTISAGTVTAIAGDRAAGIGAGTHGSGGRVEISGGEVVARAGDDGTAVGGFKIPPDAMPGLEPSPFGFLKITGGVLRVASRMVVPGSVAPASQVEVWAPGRIEGPATNRTGGGPIEGGGQVWNGGTITLAANRVLLGATSSGIFGRHVRLTFHSGASAAPAPAPVTVFARTLAEGLRSLPAAPTPPKGTTFLGWNTRSDGKGVTVTTATDLEQLAGPSVDGAPRSLSLYATFTAPPPPPVTMPFVDVPKGSYFYDAVRWAVQQGITTGTSPTTFSPHEAVTRAQIATFLHRKAGSPPPTGPQFADVPANSYFASAVRWMRATGLTTGVGGTNYYKPYDRASRAELITLLWRSAGSPNLGTSHGFRDVPKGSYYERAVTWAVKRNITTGTSPTTFAPTEPVTRAQTVTFLWRMG